ncbi:MAG: glucokinase [Desulfurivibrionaceae bacterium]
MAYILAADVGGTKIRLGLFSRESGALELVREEVLPSKKFSTFARLLDSFLKEDRYEVDSACLGVAGPVKGDRVRLTNLPWTIDGGEIKRSFALDTVYLINDLQATAFSIPWLVDQDILELRRGRADPEGRLAVIAPGTGLGMAYIIREQGRHIVSPSEGGHGSFAPADSLEMELLDYYREKIGQVSYEDLCSGGGIPLIYEFLQQKGSYPASEVRALNLQDGDPAPVIVEYALDQERPCPLCRATVEHFCLILAGACSRLALTVLATGGVYIAGGIPPRILPFLRQKAFLQRFSDNRRMGHLLEDIPVKVVLNHRAPLLGAAARAREK